MSYPTPPGSPEATPPPDSRNLPEPPSPTTSRQKEARLCLQIAKYYWITHFEAGPVDPASFIDRLMTDYVDYEPDVVGEWVENMRTPYKLYRVCLNYGATRGTPSKALEAKKFQRITIARQPQVQDVRNSHRQRRMAATIARFNAARNRQNEQPQAVPEVPPRGSSLAPTVAVDNEVVEEGKDEENDQKQNTTSVTLPPSGPKKDKNQQKPRRSKSNQSLNDAEENRRRFEELLQEDGNITFPPTPDVGESYEKHFNIIVKALKATNEEGRYLKDLAERSIPAGVQGNFVDAICLLWVRELRPVFQKAIRPENIDRHPNRRKAILEAVNKEPKLKRLNNFVEGWDLSRFAYLVDLCQDAVPGEKGAAAAVKRLRDARNAKSHEDYKGAPLTDSQFHVLIHDARTHLPKIRNALAKSSVPCDDIYAKLKRLAGRLRFPQAKDDSESDYDLFE